MKLLSLSPRNRFTSSKGASLVEYGFIVGVVVFASIATVAIFGSNVNSYFSGSAAVIDNPELARGGSDEIVWVRGEPVIGTLPEDVFGLRVEGGNYLIGTPFTDPLALDGTHLGVYGLEGNDNLLGTDSNEFFVGGPGTDIAIGGNGDDVYAYALGDGRDFFNENTGSGIDTLHMPTINAYDIQGRYVGASFELTMPDGEEVMLIGARDAPQFNGIFERAVFADMTLNSIQEVREWMVEIQKHRSSITGSREVETFSHTASADGSYEIFNDHSFGDRDDLGDLVFTDLSLADVTIRLPSGNDLYIDTPDGDTVTVDNQGETHERSGIQRLIFQGSGSDEILSKLDILEIAMNAQKPSGSVNGTLNTDVFFHDMAADGSYTLTNDNFRNHPLEYLEIRNATPADVSFRMTGGGNWLGTDTEILFADGDVVRVTRMWDEFDPRYGIGGLVFANDLADPNDDYVMEFPEMIAIMMDDRRNDGFIRGTDLQIGDTFIGELTDPDTDFYTGYEGTEPHTDTLDFRIHDITLVGFSVINDEDLVMVLPNGRTFTVIDQFDNRTGFEEFIFDDGTGTPATYFEPDIAALAGFVYP